VDTVCLSGMAVASREAVDELSCIDCASSGLVESSRVAIGTSVELSEQMDSTHGLSGTSTASSAVVEFVEAPDRLDRSEGLPGSEACSLGMFSFFGRGQDGASSSTSV